jgi:PhnB protein
MAFYPYLHFRGNARAAMTRYQEIFGGELVVLTFGDLPPDAGPPPPGVPAETVMHSALTNGDDSLMASDDPSGESTGTTSEGHHVTWNAPDMGEAKRVFDALADGGSVQQPLTETFFSPGFAMVIDRFGTPWMIVVDSPTP